MTEKAATVFTCVGFHVHYYWSDIIILIIDHKLIPEFDFYFKHFAMNISKHYTLFNLIIIFLKVKLTKIKPSFNILFKKKTHFFLQKMEKQLHLQMYVEPSIFLLYVVICSFLFMDCMLVCCLLHKKVLGKQGAHYCVSL